MTDNLPAAPSRSMMLWQEKRELADAVVKSNMFGLTNVDQALVLMALCEAEGLHPIIAARDYDIIQGKPTLKSRAMLARYQQAGGKVKWLELSDERCRAEFSHPQGEGVTIDWDMDRAKRAGLGGKEMWNKYRRQMLRSRVISEGINASFPAATNGLYTPEEQIDIEPVKIADAPKARKAPPPQIETKPPPAIEPPREKPAPADWKTWGVAAFAAIKEAPDINALHEWSASQHEKLTELQARFRSSYDKIMTAIGTRVAELETAPPAATPADAAPSGPDHGADATNGSSAISSPSVGADVLEGDDLSVYRIAVAKKPNGDLNWLDWAQSMIQAAQVQETSDDLDNLMKAHAEEMPKAPPAVRMGIANAVATRRIAFGERA